MLANEQRKRCEKKTIANVIGQGADRRPTDKEMTNELGSHRRQLEAGQGQSQSAVGKLTDDQIDVIAGKRENLAGKIQETYGVGKDETEKQLTAWQKRVKEADPVR